MNDTNTFLWLQERRVYDESGIISQHDDEQQKFIFTDIFSYIYAPSLTTDALFELSFCFF